MLIYEALDWTEVAVGADFKSTQRDIYKKLGRDASLGITQLEVYKASIVSTKYDKKNLSYDQLAKILIDNPAKAIEFAATYMRYLKERIKYRGRSLTDWEAALGYCGCSGVGENKSNRKFKYDRVVNWLDGGEAPNAGAAKRRSIMEGWVKDAANECWKCIDKHFCKTRRV